MPLSTVSPRSPKGCTVAHIAAFFVLCCSATFLYGADLYVSKVGSHKSPFSSWANAATNIQYAIATASKGDTVWVSNGTYSVGYVAVGGPVTNTVYINKAITVRSVKGPSHTTITGRKGSAPQRCVYMTTNALLTGFTIKDGGTLNTLSSNPVQACGGGIFINGSSFISNCVIQDCVSTGTYGYGGGTYGPGQFKNCTLKHNRAEDGGAAAYGTFIQCDFVSNTAYGVGGAVCLSTVSNSFFRWNRSDRSGGGAAASTLRQCTMLNNSSDIGGGAVFDSDAEGCYFLWNGAIYGGAAFASEVGHSTNWYNYAYDGGAFYSCGGTNNYFYYNEATNRGGAAFQSHLVNSTMQNNRAKDGGASYGSYLYQCNVNNNLAENNGGGASFSTGTLCQISANTASNRGGGLYNSEALRCDITDNQAYYRGGGAYAEWYRGYSMVECTVSSNLAGVTSSGEALGGGVYGYPLVQRCTVSFNSATGFSLVQGGGLYNSYAENCIITGNRADRRGSTFGGEGGGAYDCALLYCTIADNWVSDGTALSEGGGVKNCVATNTVVYNNQGSHSNYFSSTFAYCCSAPLPAGVNNTAVDPLLAVNYKLSAGSSCIDAGRSTTVAEDRAGIGRPLDGNNDNLRFYDIGAYEYVHATADSDDDLMPDNWEIAYSTDPLHDDANEDPDNDGCVNVQEYGAMTHPNGASSFLGFTSVAIWLGRADLEWRCSSEAHQILEYSLNPADGDSWVTVVSNAPPVSTNGALIHMTGPDTDVIAYRLRAQRDN